MDEEYLRGMHKHLKVKADYDTWVKDIQGDEKYLTGMHKSLKVKADYGTWKSNVFGAAPQATEPVTEKKNQNETQTTINQSSVSSPSATTSASPSIPGIEIETEGYSEAQESVIKKQMDMNPDYTRDDVIEVFGGLINSKKTEPVTEEVAPDQVEAGGAVIDNKAAAPWKSEDEPTEPVIEGDGDGKGKKKKTTIGQRVLGKLRKRRGDNYKLVEGETSLEVFRDPTLTLDEYDDIELLDEEIDKYDRANTYEGELEELFLFGVEDPNEHIPEKRDDDVSGFSQGQGASTPGTAEIREEKKKSESAAKEQEELDKVNAWIDNASDEEIKEAVSFYSKDSEVIGMDVTDSKVFLERAISKFAERYTKISSYVDNLKIDYKTSSDLAKEQLEIYKTATTEEEKLEAYEMYLLHLGEANEAAASSAKAVGLINAIGGKMASFSENLIKTTEKSPFDIKENDIQVQARQSIFPTGLVREASAIIDGSVTGKFARAVLDPLVGQATGDYDYSSIPDMRYDDPGLMQDVLRISSSMLLDGWIFGGLGKQAQPIAARLMMSSPKFATASKVMSEATQKYVNAGYKIKAATAMAAAKNKGAARLMRQMMIAEKAVVGAHEFGGYDVLVEMSNVIQNGENPDLVKLSKAYVKGAVKGGVIAPSFQIGRGIYRSLTKSGGKGAEVGLQRVYSAATGFTTESYAFAAATSILERGALPTWEEFVHSAATLGGLKLRGVMSKASFDKLESVYKEQTLKNRGTFEKADSEGKHATLEEINNAVSAEVEKLMAEKEEAAIDGKVQPLEEDSEVLAPKKFTGENKENLVEEVKEEVKSDVTPEVAAEVERATSKDDIKDRNVFLQEGKISDEAQAEIIKNKDKGGAHSYAYETMVRNPNLSEASQMEMYNDHSGAFLMSREGSISDAVIDLMITEGEVHGLNLESTQASLNQSQRTKVDKFLKDNRVVNESRNTIQNDYESKETKQKAIDELADVENISKEALQVIADLPSGEYEVSDNIVNQMKERAPFAVMASDRFTAKEKQEAVNKIDVNPKSKDRLYIDSDQVDILLNLPKDVSLPKDIVEKLKRDDIGKVLKSPRFEGEVFELDINTIKAVAHSLPEISVKDLKERFSGDRELVDVLIDIKKNSTKEFSDFKENKNWKEGLKPEQVKLFEEAGVVPIEMDAVVVARSVGASTVQEVINMFKTFTEYFGKEGEDRREGAGESFNWFGITMFTSKNIIPLSSYGDHAMILKPVKENPIIITADAAREIIKKELGEWGTVKERQEILDKYGIDAIQYESDLNALAWVRPHENLKLEVAKETKDLTAEDISNAIESKEVKDGNEGKEDTRSSKEEEQQQPAGGKESGGEKAEEVKLTKDEQAVADKMAKQQKEGKKLSGSKKDFDIYDANKKAIDKDVERQMKVVSEAKKTEFKEQQKVESFARRVGKEGKKTFNEVDEKFYAENKDAIDKLVPKFQKEPPKDKSKARSLAQKIHEGKEEFTEEEAQTYAEFKEEVHTEMEAIAKANNKRYTGRIAKSILEGLKNPKAPTEAISTTEMLRELEKQDKKTKKGERRKRKFYNSIASKWLTRLKKVGKLTAAKASQLAREAAKVEDPKTLRTFVRVADKILAQADYSAKLNRAIGLKKRLKNALKGKVASNYREAINKLIKVSPDRVDIDNFISKAETLVESLKKASTKIDKETGEPYISPKDRAVTDESFHKDLDKMAEEHRESVIEELMEGEEGLDRATAEMVVDGADVTKRRKAIQKIMDEVDGRTLVEATEIYNERLDEITSKKREVIIDFVNETIEDAAFKGKLKFINDIRVEDLPMSDMLVLEKIVDNIVKNGNESFLNDVKNIHDRQKGRDILSGIKVKNRKATKAKFHYGVKNIEAFVEAIVLEAGLVTDVLFGIGFTEWGRANEALKRGKNADGSNADKAKPHYEEIELNELIREISKTEKNINSPLSKNERAWYSDLKQRLVTYEAKGLSKEEALKDFKELAENSVNNIKNLEDKYGGLGKELEKFYEEKIKDLKSIEEWELSKGQEQIIGKVIDLFKEHYESFKEHMLHEEGIEIEPYEDYTSVIVRSTGRILRTDLDNMNIITSMAGVKPRGAHERKIKGSAGKDKYIDPNFEISQLNELHMQKRAVLVSRQIKIMSDMLRSPELQELIGITNVHRLREMIGNSVNFDLGISNMTEVLGTTDAAKAAILGFNTLNRASVRAVFGLPVFNFLKQFSSATIASTTRMAGEALPNGDFNTMASIVNPVKVFRDVKMAEEAGLFEETSVGRRDVEKEVLEPFFEMVKKGELPSEALKKLADFDEKVLKEIMMSGVKHGDRIPARAAYPQYYAQYMRKNGVDVPTEAKERQEWWNEQGKMDTDMKKKANHYAQRSVDRDQNVSAQEYGSPLQQSSFKDPVVAAGKKVLIPFTSFKFAHDSAVLNGMKKVRVGMVNGNKQAIIEGIADLASKFNENVAFVGLASYYLPAVTMAIAEQMGLNTDGYDELGSDERQKKKFWGRILTDMTPFMFHDEMSNYEIDAANRFFYYLTANKELWPTYEDYLREGQETFYKYRKMPETTTILDHTGQAGIAASRMIEGVNWLTSSEKDKRDFKDPWGNDVRLSKEQVNSLYFPNFAKFMNGIGAGPGEFVSYGRLIESDVRRRRSTTSIERYVKTHEGDLNTILRDALEDKDLGTESFIKREVVSAAKDMYLGYNEFFTNMVKKSGSAKEASGIFLVRYQKLKTQEERNKFLMSTIIALAVKKDDDYIGSFILNFKKRMGKFKKEGEWSPVK